MIRGCEVAILRDNHTALAVGDGCDLIITRSISLRQVAGVYGLMAGGDEVGDQPGGKLCIHQKLSSHHPLNALDCGKPGSKRIGRTKIVRLDIRIVGDNLVSRHAPAEQLEQHRNRISKSTNTWLAVADGRVNRDP